MVRIVFFLYAQCGMGHGAQTFFGNQFACGTAYTVRFVIDAYKSSLKMFDEFALALGKTCRCLAFEDIGAFFEGLESGRCV